MSKQAKTFSVKFVEVLTARNAEQFSKDTQTALNNAQAGSAAIDLVMSKPEFAELAKDLLKKARIADHKQDKANFIAVKVLVKIVSSLVALGQNLKSEVDPYTRAIVKNLLKVDDLNNKETLMCLSTAVQYDELEQAKALIGRLSCTAGTASTQASSTRMMFLHLGICEVQKGKRNDITRFCDNDRAKAFSALFTANA